MKTFVSPNYIKNMTSADAGCPRFFNSLLFISLHSKPSLCCLPFRDLKTLLQNFGTIGIAKRLDIADTM
jgi:hypothetical protein